MINKRFHKSYQDHETHETYIPHVAHRPHLSFVIRHSSFVILLSLFTLSFFTLLSGCASMSSPDGGPYDETPPRVVRSTPDNQAVNAAESVVGNRNELSVGEVFEVFFGQIDLYIVKLQY